MPDRHSRLFGLQRLQQPLRLQQGAADRVRRVGIESGARLHDNVRDRHDGSAQGAFAVRPDLGAARGVPEVAQPGPVELLAAPVAQRAQGGPQGDAALGDDVLVPGRRLLVAALFEDALGGQRLQPAARTARGMPRWTRKSL